MTVSYECKMFTIRGLSVCGQLGWRQNLHYAGCRLNLSKIYIRANSIKLFWRKFTHTFFKLDLFINIHNVRCIAIKRSSLQKE